MNILYLFQNYRDGDGGSAAIDFLINIDRDFYENYLVVCKQKHTTKSINIVEEKSETIIKEFFSQPDVVIHYVRSAQSNILEHILRLTDKNIPVITTVIQSPGYKRLMLSPFEIRNTNYFVFIDKSSFNNKIISFIPTYSRTCIYIIPPADKNWQIQKTEDITLEQNRGRVVYGRGSTLSKCPKDMFLVFDKIDVENKIFRIVGIPEGDNWVRREAEKRPNVEIYPLLKLEEWFSICKTFDVFLYQLPFDSYASIDFNLGLAMSMQKPVVYMGCEAPKERIEHGVSGFIANSVEEMAQFATDLGKSYELRKKIGKEGRKGVIRMAEDNNAMDRFHKVYEEAISLKKIKRIPLGYRIMYLRYCYSDVIRNILNKYK